VWCCGFSCVGVIVFLALVVMFFSCCFSQVVLQLFHIGVIALLAWCYCFSHVGAAIFLLLLLLFSCGVEFLLALVLLLFLHGAIVFFMLVLLFLSY